MVFSVLVRLSEPYLHRDVAFPRCMAVLVQVVREMVAFALLSTGCCFQAMVLCSPLPFCSIRPNRMSCHHPSCLWYIMNQVQFLLGFLALCKASDKTRRDTKTLKSQVLTLPPSWLLLQQPGPILLLSSFLIAFLPHYKRHHLAAITSPAVGYVTWLPSNLWESYWKSRALY